MISNPEIKTVKPSNSPAYYRDAQNLLVGFLAIITFLFAFIVIIAYICLFLKKYDNLCLQGVCKVVYSFVDNSKQINSDFIKSQRFVLKSVFEYCISISVALSSLLLTITSVISYVKKMKNLEKSSGIAEYPISTNSDDTSLAIMNEFYSDADKVVIFSSSFKWLYDKRRGYIRKTLEEVDDVKLIVTGNGKDRLIKELEKLDSSLSKCVVPRQLNSAKRFSFVKKRGNTRCVLYRQDIEKNPRIVVFSENVHNTLWLDALENIIAECITN